MNSDMSEKVYKRLNSIAAICTIFVGKHSNMSA